MIKLWGVPQPHDGLHIISEQYPSSRDTPYLNCPLNEAPHVGLGIKS